MKSRTLFRLREDYKNPKPDRRSSSDIRRLKVIPKGTWFIRGASDAGRIPHWMSSPSYSGVTHELAETLMPFLEEIKPASVDEISVLYGLSGDSARPLEFVASLVKSGKITLGDFVEFLRKPKAV